MLNPSFFYTAAQNMMQAALALVCSVVVQLYPIGDGACFRNKARQGIPFTATRVQAGELPWRKSKVVPDQFHHACGCRVMAHLDTAMYSHGLPPKKKNPTDTKTGRAF
jgi:hypothetical protein